MTLRLVDWPLVGRRDELALIGDLLGRSGVRGIVLAGTSGVGKTRLGEETVELAKKAGFATARVSATRAAATVPLGALAPLLPAIEATGTDLLSKAKDALLEHAAGRPLLLLVDDAHLLDEASATLLHQLAADANLFVVATIRNGEPVPDPVVALWKDGHAERVEIEPLDEAECERLLTTALAGPVAGATLRQLYRASEGNPLILRELLLGAREAGRLQQEGGLWQVSGPPVASAALGELISRRLEGLDPTERQALELVALGEPVGVAVLEAVVGLSAIASLEDKGLVEVREDGKRLNCWLVHPLHGETVRAAMPTLRARMVRRQLADATHATGAARKEDVLRLAVLRLESGSVGPDDAALLLAAARQARAAEDYPAASRLARAALDAGGGPEAGYVLGDTLSEQGEREEAERVLEQATGAGPTDELRTLIAVSRSDNLFWHLGQADRAVAVVREAEAVVTDPVSHDQLVAQRASFDLILGRPLQALEAVEPNLERSVGRALVESTIVASPAYAYTGRPDKAAEISDRGLAVHLELNDDLMAAHPGIHIISKALALSLAGRLAEAEELARFGYDAAIGARRPAGHAWFAMILSQIALQRGRLATAERFAREGVAIFRQTRHQGERWCLGGLALATGQRGDAEGARAATDAMAGTVEDWLFTEPDVRRGMAWSQLAAGHLPEARDGLLDAADLAERTGQRTLEVTALHDLVRIGCVAIVIERLQAAAGHVEGPLAPLLAAHAVALSSGDAQSLTDVADGFAALGAHLLAAEAGAEAAVAWRRAGDPRRADAVANQARQRAVLCEGANTPALVATDAPVPLTARERDVATLAASGLSSKAIADRLYLSVRTVDNHLQRAYTKLGIRSRDELSAALGRN